MWHIAGLSKDLNHSLPYSQIVPPMIYISAVLLLSMVLRKFSVVTCYFGAVGICNEIEQ